MSDQLFDSDDTFFADIIVPVPIPSAFSYRVPREMSQYIKMGCRVIVPFGKGRILTGIVAEVHQRAPQKYQSKYIIELLDENPVVNSIQIWLFAWIADYYLCHIGEAMNVALPAGLKVNSESMLQINPDFDGEDNFSEIELKVMQAILEKENLPYKDLKNYVSEHEINKLVKNLIKKNAILIFEEIKERYKPKKLKKIRLKKVYETEEDLLGLIDSLEKNTKQQAVVLAYLTHIPIDKLAHLNIHGVEKAKFNEGNSSAASLKTLIEKEIFEQFEINVSRFPTQTVLQNTKVLLSEAQQQAEDEILAKFDKKDVVLFHGITGSGKTEVYINLIQKVLENGQQVLLLLPEIALTTQIVGRLMKVFGDKMGVYHSKFSDNERVEVWQGVLSGKYDFVVGVRSAIFLPFNQLGLIIVDEEHESSYKQYDPAPRYHARDVSIMLAAKHGAKVLLGSATPSLESYYQAENNRYGLVKLQTRYANASLPEIRLIDIKEERKNGTLVNDFSSFLIQEIKDNLAKKEQTIIFQNRRGYAPYLNCEVCNWIGNCHQCAVSLTHHYHENALVCHYCGYRESVPKICPECQSGKLKSVGVGTEKIEDDLSVLFPESKILRMDLDTTRSKNAYQLLINEFEHGDVDILVGTQMISKGLDFGNVSLVGVFNADRMIYFPDFRAAERAFQMLMQVSGRAGRKDKPGRVLIQTGGPQHPLLQMIVEHDYEGFYAKEIAEREHFNYPPFSRLIEISVKHENRTLAHQAAGLLAQQLGVQLGTARVLGPEKGLVERVRNKYIFIIWLKLEKNKLNTQATKAFLSEQIIEIQSRKEYKNVRIIVNVDAV